jgi:hypothetical protein
MEVYRRRVLIVVTTFATYCLITLWLAFGLHVSHFFVKSRVFFFLLAFLVILPIPLYFPLAKRKKFLTRSTAIALALLSAGLVFISVGTITFAFNPDNVWSDRAFDLSRAFIVVACLIFIWLGIKSARAEYRGQK